MKISLNWLKRYIDLDLPIEELSEILTAIGLEVEGIETIEGVKGGLEGIVVGKVLTCDKHPNADKLSLTQVDTGNGEPIQIVCGAPNVAAGQSVLVATVGTTLYPTDGEPWKIKKGKIRGEVSEGMICAEDELGLGTSHEGIMILEGDVSPGTEAKKMFDLKTDYVFDIGLTPNRSDATSHLGVARDLAAYLRINHDWSGSVKMPEVGDFKVDANILATDVTVENEVACPRYSGVNLSEITIKESPEWMQRLLSAIGIRPINNVVDITNFVLHETGQPLHAFDYEKISGHGIIVKCLDEGSEFISLDGVERKLTNKDLMICDADSKPMCIAGVFGGINSGVTDQTDKIFLEAAHFEAGSVRTSSTHHLLRTEAAKIFEKGSDPSKTVYALKRASLLLKEHANAHISSEITDIYPNKIEPREIQVRYQNVNRLIGTEIEPEKVHEILRAMKMELKPLDDSSVIVMVPTNKADVTREVDVIEEILRIYGFNKVDMPDKITTSVHPVNYPTKRDVQNIISDHLSANGFNEMMGLSLVESSLYPEYDSSDLVHINNTSNIHLDIMRPDALKSGLRNVLHNINHQQTDLKLYEFGKSYRSTEDGFREFEFLSFFLCGKMRVESWRESNKNNVDFYELKQIVRQVLSRIGISSFQTSEIDTDSRFDYGLEYHRGKNSIVKLGKVSEDILKQMDIGTEVYYAIADFRYLSDCASQSKVQVSEISRYPSVRRDLALVIDDSVKFDEIRQITAKTDKKLIRDINLFDVYKNEKQLGKGKKSYAVSFLFQDDNKTLKDKEVDKVISALIKNFESKLGAQIRS